MVLGKFLAVLKQVPFLYRGKGSVSHVMYCAVRFHEIAQTEIS